MGRASVTKYGKSGDKTYSDFFEENKFATNNFLSDAEKKKLRKEFDDKTSAFLKSYSDRGEDEDDIDADVYNDFFKDLNTKPCCRCHPYFCYGCTGIRSRYEKGSAKAECLGIRYFQ